MKHAQLVLIFFLTVLSQSAWSQKAYVSCYKSSQLKVVNLETGAILDSIVMDTAPLNVIVAPDRKQLVVTNLVMGYVVDVPSGTIQKLAPTRAFEVIDGTYDTAGKSFYLFDQSSTIISSFDRSSLKPGPFGYLEKATFPHIGAVDPNTGNLVTVNLGSADLTRFDPTSLVKVGENMKVAQTPQDIVFIPGSSMAYISSFVGNQVLLYDMEEGKRNTTINELGGPTRMALNEKGDRLYVICELASSLAVIDTKSNEVLAKIPLGNSPKRMDFTPDEKHLIVTNYADNALSVIDLEKNEVKKIIEGVGEGPFGIGIVE